MKEYSFLPKILKFSSFLPDFILILKGFQYSLHDMKKGEFEIISLEIKNFQI